MLQDKIQYEIIIQAIQQDEAAIVQVIAHYKGYINYLSLREVELADGQRVKYVDEEMARRLEVKLMESIVRFRVRIEKSK